MTWLNHYRMRLAFAGFVAATLLSGGHAKADFTFGEVTKLGPTVNTGGNNRGTSLSADGLTLLFTNVNKPSGYDLYIVSRETLDDDWGPAVNLGPTVNCASYDMMPSISTDGLELYFGSGRNGQKDLWVTKRETINSNWGTPANLGPTVNSAAKDVYPSISGDGLELYFSSLRSDGLGFPDIWVTQRLTKDDPWQEPVNLGPMVNSSSEDFAPDITADGLTLIFSSKRPGKYSSYADLWATTRRTTADPWREPFNLGPVINTDDVDWADFSPDGTRLFLTCFHRPGGSSWYDIWQVPIIPVVDFTGDLQVDIEDLIMLIEHWGQNEPLCDVGPAPFGDGVVGAADLEVLMSYWGQEVYGPHFIAHWKLDEETGNIAHDSATENDGVVMGDAAWQPDSGLIDGALALDGVDDYVLIDRVINPMRGPLSVFAWIKGGGPGQVVLSQQAGANWLMTDASEGKLMTELGVTADGSELYSETGIIDGDWHRVGFVWDGSARMLYVDAVRVAEDVQTSLASAYGRHYLGCAKDFAPTTFFSGLIDDVRMYNRAVKP